MNEFLVRLTCSNANVDVNVNIFYETENDRLDKLDLIKVLRMAKKGTSTRVATIDFIYKLGG